MEKTIGTINLTTGKASELICIISKAGDRYGNLLLEFMETYSLTGLYQATAEQLREFIENKNLEVKNENSY